MVVTLLVEVKLVVAWLKAVESAGGEMLTVAFPQLAVYLHLHLYLVK